MGMADPEGKKKPMSLDELASRRKQNTERFKRQHKALNDILDALTSLDAEERVSVLRSSAAFLGHDSFGGFVR